MSVRSSASSASSSSLASIKSKQSSHRYSSSLPAQSYQSSHQFHRRNATSTTVPRPSHKPPSTFSSFRGDIKSQDIFDQAFKQKNEKLRVLFPGSDRFEMERMDIWNHDAMCTPCLIVQPKDKKQVSDCITGYTFGVLKCLTAKKKHGAKLTIPRLCVAGGRNSINTMRDGSIVLDMSLMRHVKVDYQNRTVRVQGGARVMDLDASLAEYGLMAVLPPQQNLGIVGCIMGGGLGYASRKWGMACDNVLSADIILADGRLKLCSTTQHSDLFASICGGGGGVGVVVSITLRTYPLMHAALLTYTLPTVDMRQRRLLIGQWANWICGDVPMDDGDLHSDGPQSNMRKENSNGGIGNEVDRNTYSKLILPTNSAHVGFMGTSVDDNAIPQTDGFLSKYNSEEKKKKRRAPFSFLGAGSGKQSSIPEGYWDNIPGLADLIHNQFGLPSRQNLQFRMLRYADQLQSHSNEYFTPGNVYLTTKYCKSLTKRVTEILVQATMGEYSPNNQSKIYIMAMGGEIAHGRGKPNVGFNARKMNYCIFVEGKWDAKKENKEKEKVKSWVNWIVNQLHLAEGIQSTAHPESTRDQVSKSGRSKPPAGWYNFDEKNGRRLEGLKRRRDPRNVFSLASRVSWCQGTKYTDDETVLSNYSLERPATNFSAIDVDNLKDGELEATDCLTPRRHQDDKDDAVEQVLEAASTDDSDHVGDAEDYNSSVDDPVDSFDLNGSANDDISDDVQRLLSLTTSDEDLKDWSLAPVRLQRVEDTYNGDAHDAKSPTSTTELSF